MEKPNVTFTPKELMDKLLSTRDGLTSLIQSTYTFEETLGDKITVDQYKDLSQIRNILNKLLDGVNSSLYIEDKSFTKGELASMDYFYTLGSDMNNLEKSYAQMLAAGETSKMLSLII